jgi:hypothetical protein
LAQQFIGLINLFLQLVFARLQLLFVALSRQKKARQYQTKSDQKNKGAIT